MRGEVDEWGKKVKDSKGEREKRIREVERRGRGKKKG
jgi:hypothetical protein